MRAIYVFRAAVLAVIPSVVASGCSPNARLSAQDTEVASRVRVRTAAVEAAHLAEPIHATGLVLDESERTLSFAVEGVVASISVDEGDSFRRGQVLARLELATVDARLDQATAAFDRAERDLERARRLEGTGSLPRQMLDDATTASDVSRADVRLARFARRHAVLVAESDGLVLGRAADAGETVGAGTPILVVSLADEGRIVRVSLTDREVVRVRTGDVADVTIDAFEARTIAGTVRRIAGAPDRSSGLFPVEIASDGLRELGDRVVAGLVARATITPTDAHDVHLVPTRALVEADGRTGFVWALDANGATATRKDVAIAFLHDDRVAIASGLDGVTTVITDGAPYVRSRMRLEVESGAVR